MLATCDIQPCFAERISFDEVAEAHRRLEAGRLGGKLACGLCQFSGLLEEQFSAAKPPDQAASRIPSAMAVRRMY
jgi:hypothetical protein